MPQNYVAGDKNKVVAALLAFFAGPLGLHGFYLGNNQMGLILLLSNVVFLPLACIIIGFFGYALVGLVCLAQAILYLVASDGEFYQKYVIEKRWF
ncbi:MAG: TM2 domain-containing protein [Chloroflexi bacterium]|nr:TM2 domain-containing protein [Chloroflexota bacterium]